MPATLTYDMCNYALFDFIVLDGSSLRMLKRLSQLPWNWMETLKCVGPCNKPNEFAYCIEFNAMERFKMYLNLIAAEKWMQETGEVRGEDAREKDVNLIRGNMALVCIVHNVHRISQMKWILKCQSDETTGKRAKYFRCVYSFLGEAAKW